MPKRPRRVVRRVLFPRYTAFIGMTAMYTVPIDVREFAEVDVRGWQGTGIGSTPASVTFTIQRSADLENWVDEAAFSPPADDEEMHNYHLAYPWLRAKAAVAGSDPGISCWLLGDFVARDAPGAGEAP